MRQNWSIDQRRTIRNLIIIILMLSIFTNLMVDSIESGRLIILNCRLSLQEEGVREMHLDFSYEDAIEKADEMNLTVGDLITVLMVLNDYRVEDKDLDSLSKTEVIRYRNRMVRLKAEEFLKLSNYYTCLIADMEAFPVPKSNDTSMEWVDYVDSWGNERTYGGERRHEGTDLMGGVNQAGLYPVLSVSDGTITNMGWLELGGYRIGITSDNGIYYYYAHMASYADLKVGDSVIAGQFLGFMGNTGYSQVEGTSGKFDVHLHFGIYLTDTEGNDIAVNPYYLLKHTENKVLYYNYGL